MFDATTRAEADADPLLWWGAIVLIAAALVSPLFVTPLPPLLDYPNHLARMLVILLRDDPVIARIYSVDPEIVPNVAMDLVVPPLAGFLPLDVAGRVFIAACLLLPVAGAAALHRALFQRRSYWPLGIALVSYNGLLFLGFLNFVAGLGLALLAAGIWVRQTHRSATRRVATASLFALALFFCHLTTVAFFGGLIAAMEIAHVARARRDQRSARALARRAIILAAPFVIPAALFLLGSKLAAKILDRAPHTSGGWWAALRREGLHIKFQGLTLPFRTYEFSLGPLHENLDLLAFVLMFALVLRALIRRRLRLSVPCLAVAALSMLAYPLVPSAFGTAALVDWRLPLFAVFLCFSGLAPHQPRDAITRILTGGLVVLFVARIATIAVVWQGHNRDLDDLARVIAPVEAGAKVLAVTTTPLPIPGGDSPSRGVIYEIDATMHLPALLLLRQHAFWPNLFTSETLQLVHVRPPYRALSAEQAVLPTVTALDAPSAGDRADRPFVLNWRENFDYVLVMRPTALAVPPDPGSLDLIDEANIAALYRVRH